MKYRFLYLTFFIFFMATCFGQDIIIKKDSTKISANVIEINPYEIKYNRYDNPNGPVYVIDKNDVASLIYQNGVREVFTKTEPVKPVTIDVATVNTSSPKDSTKYQVKLSDYIKFNLQAGVVVNNVYSNKPSEDNPHIGQGASEGYSGINKDKYFINPAFNLNLLFGKNPYVKHVLGIGYLHSHGEFNYDYASGRNYEYYSTHLHYDSKLDYINLYSGLRFRIGKHFFAEPLVSLNIIAYKNVRVSGYSQTVQANPYSSLTYTTDIKYYDNVKANDNINIKNVTLSLTPKIGYEGFIKKQLIGMYASYNINIRNNLPWWCIGVTFYPFKSLCAKPEEQKTKSKLFKDSKLNIEAGAVLNAGFTNTDETYSGVKPLNPHNHKMGYYLGSNFSYGRSAYFKHFINASVIQSQAELIKKSYNYSEHIGNYRYEYINSNTYNSTVCFFNLGSGIRFIAFKRFSFDNGIALNIPFYSGNKIQSDEKINQYDNYTGSLISSTTTPMGNKTSNEFLLKKTNWVFLAKISYEFTIKQNRLGAFCGWNYAWKNDSQWHMFGLIYYPFKKLK